MSFSHLVATLTDAINTPHEGAVNEAQCQAEAEIIGYLIGVKVAKNNTHYVPSDFGNPPAPILATLNAVASKASVVLLRARKKEASQEHLSEEALRTQRD